MKSAKEMFEELDYHLILKNSYVIVYEKNTDYSLITLRFLTKDKQFIKEDELGLAKFISLEELKAIVKQAEELRWIDEKSK